MEILETTILLKPLDARYNVTVPHKIRTRRHTPRDITAVGLKYLISGGEHKEIHMQFGMTVTMYLCCLRVALESFVEVLEFHYLSRVW